MKNFISNDDWNEKKKLTLKKSISLQIQTHDLPFQTHQIFLHLTEAFIIIEIKFHYIFANSLVTTEQRIIKFPPSTRRLQFLVNTYTWRFCSKSQENFNIFIIMFFLNNETTDWPGTWLNGWNSIPNNS